MRAQAILFDKDGTLFDHGKTWTGWLADLINTSANGDEDHAEKIADVLGFHRAEYRFLPDSIAIAGTSLEMAETALDHFPHDTPEALAAYFDKEAAGVDPVEVVPLIAYLDDLLRQGLALGVATNDSEHAARTQLGAVGILEKFEFLAGYDSGFGVKPHPGMCTAFAEHLGVAPDQTVMVGDSLHDLHAGRAAGMQCVAVLTGVATARDLESAADVVLPDISHLPAWLHGT